MEQSAKLVALEEENTIMGELIEQKEQQMQFQQQAANEAANTHGQKSGSGPQGEDGPGCCNGTASQGECVCAVQQATLREQTANQ
eukprot:8566131-Pyramimonas_sp.AAC.1